MKKTIIILAALVAASCTKGGNFETATQVSLSLNMPGELPTPGTRALTFQQENTIADAYILVFDNAGGLTEIIKGDSITSTPNMNYKQGDTYSGAGTFQVTLAPNMGATKTNLVALANCEAILNATIGTTVTAATRGKSRDEILAQVFETINNPMYASGGAIPMYGETGAFPVASNVKSMSIDMMRAVARIDVGVGVIAFNDTDKTYSWTGLDASGNAIPLQITSITIVGAMNQYLAAPSLANVTGRVAMKTTIPSTATRFSLADSKSKFAFAVSSGNGLSRNIYVPEAAQSGVVTDANYQNRMVVVVGGKYKGSATETFYRLDFAPDGTNVVDVLRNHTYFFNLAGASGAGQATVDDAVASKPTNISYHVVDWSNSTLPNQTLTR